MTSELEYLDKACEITVFPQPKAPGMAVVPPWTQLEILFFVNKSHISKKYLYRMQRTGKEHPILSGRSTEGNLPEVSLYMDGVDGPAILVTFLL